MNPTDSFDRNVSEWLHADADHRVPPHLDAVLRRTSSERQRPAWSSLERWLPVQSTARFAQVPRMAWLLVVLGLIIAIGATALAIGTRTPQRQPSPFGVSSIGTVLYGAADGDIYALDTATNQSRPLVVGPTIDRAPSFSPDGIKFVFYRTEAGGTTTTTMLAGADGSNPRVLTPKLHGVAQLAWSPAGDQLAYAGQIDGTFGLFTIGLDGTTRLVVLRQPGPAFAILEDPHWRSDGQELVFLWGHLDIVPQMGVYAVHADGTGLRAIVEPTVPAPTQLSLSPDGTKAVYSTSSTGPARLHVVDLDAGTDKAIAFDGSEDDRRPVWSSDSSRLVFERHSAGSYRLAVGPVDGGPVVEIGPAQPDKIGGSHAQFSPDGTRVLVFYESDGSSWVLDPADGSAVRLAGEITSPLTWQSTAP